MNWKHRKTAQLFYGSILRKPYHIRIGLSSALGAQIKDNLANTPRY